MTKEFSRPLRQPNAFAAPKVVEGQALKTSLVEQVYDAILRELDTGALRPGQRIVAAKVAERLGLSRAPVREALHILAGQGLVELHPDRGAILRQMSREDLVGIYELMGPVAAVGLAAAAKRIEIGDNALRIEAALDRIRRSAGIRPSFHFYLVLNDFHYLANEIGNRPYVDVVMRALQIEYWNRMLATAIDLDVHIPRYIRNYERIAASVLAGDGRAAAAIMLSHCEWAGSRIRKD